MEGFYFLLIESSLPPHRTKLFNSDFYKLTIRYDKSTKSFDLIIDGVEHKERFIISLKRFIIFLFTFYLLYTLFVDISIKEELDWSDPLMQSDKCSKLWQFSVISINLLITDNTCGLLP